MPVPYERRNNKTGKTEVTMYETVAERLTKFHDIYKDNITSIITEVIQFKDGIIVMKAVVKIDDKVYVGHAYEKEGSNFATKGSAIKVCETSCIGRALSSAGLLGSEFCSADELVNALTQQASGVTNIAPKAQTDFSNDKWRDNPIGFKSGKNEGKSYREVDDDTLIWIINQCKVESWKEKAIKEMQLRQDGQKTSVSKEEVDDLFNTNEGDKDAK